MLKSSRANMLAGLRDRRLKKQRKARIEKDYVTEIERCERVIKEVIENGKMECFISNLTPSYDVAVDVEWYLEQFGYFTCREKDLEGNYYNLKINWYN